MSENNRLEKLDDARVFETVRRRQPHTFLATSTTSSSLRRWSS
jgi:hypothetical protein